MASRPLVEREERPSHALFVALAIAAACFAALVAMS
jgi:hypothetical protein